MQYTPKMKSSTGAVLEAREMAFIQDIVVNQEGKFAFVMKFESPSSILKENLEIFKTIKVSGYYAIYSKKGGLLFTEL